MLHRTFAQLHQFHLLSIKIYHRGAAAVIYYTPHFTSDIAHVNRSAVFQVFVNFILYFFVDNGKTLIQFVAVNLPHDGAANKISFQYFDAGIDVIYFIIICFDPYFYRPSSIFAYTPTMVEDYCCGNHNSDDFSSYFPTPSEGGENLGKKLRQNTPKYPNIPLLMFSL